MSEEPRMLQDYLNEAISEFCADKGFGYPGAFIYCVSRIDETGEQVLTLGEAPGQATWQSLGMVKYLEKWFEADAEHTIIRACAHDEED